MAFLGMRKWPTPVAKPLWPFMAAGAITMYLVLRPGIRSTEWRNDPRNPYAARLLRSRCTSWL
ncbi:ATP synthase j chain-domain-containing protein [Cyathus striatus]|nr:ATP synthase j chain-domain-containing protein [Cyathus striatus]